jgi:hypothetical protein
MSVLQGLCAPCIFGTSNNKTSLDTGDGQSPYSKTWYIIVGVDKGPVGPVGQEAFPTYLIVNLGILAEWGLFFGQRAVFWIAVVANNYTGPSDFRVPWGPQMVIQPS